MALAATTQLLEDGPRNVVAKIAGTADTMDPLLFSSIIPGWPGQPLASALGIKKIEFNIESGTSIQLYWEASVNKLILSLAGWDTQDYTKFGNLWNNAGAGKTGNILMSKTGSGAFSMIIWMIKQRPAFG